MVDDTTALRIAANQRLAAELLSMLSGYQPDNLPEKRCRFVLRCRVSAWWSQDRYTLSSSSNKTLCELLGLLSHVAFLATNEKAEADTNRIADAIRREVNSLLYRSRQAYRGRFGEVVLVLFKDHAEVRISPQFTVSVQAFLSGNMAFMSSEA